MCIIIEACVFTQKLCDNESGEIAPPGGKAAIIVKFFLISHAGRDGRDPVIARQDGCRVHGE
jgi:hypothetical protein